MSTLKPPRKWNGCCRLCVWRAATRQRRGWSRFPPNVGSVFPQMYFAVFGGILMYPSKVRYRCVSKRPSKYTQIHAKYRSQKKPSIGQVSVWQYLCPGIGPAIPVSQVSVWRYLCPDRYMTIRCDTSKYTPIRGDTRQYDAILQNTHRYVAIHDNTMRYFKIHTDT